MLLRALLVTTTIGLTPPPRLLLSTATYAYADTRLRAAAVLIALQRALKPGEAGAWVSHSRFLRVLLAAAAAEQAKGRSTDFLSEWKASFPPGYRISNAAISVIDIAENGEFTLRCVDSVAHLRLGGAGQGWC